MLRTCTLILATCLLAAADRPAGADSWAASFAKEAAGDYVGAIAALQPLRQTHSDPYLLALRSGWLHYRSGRYDDAVGAYQEALRLAPTANEPRLAMISPLLAAKRWTDAERQSRQVLRDDPGCFWASYWLVECLLGAQRAREANTIARSLAERYPGDATVLEQALRCGKAAGEPLIGDIANRLAILKLAASR